MRSNVYYLSKHPRFNPAGREVGAFRDWENSGLLGIWFVLGSAWALAWGTVMLWTVVSLPLVQMGFSNKETEGAK